MRASLELLASIEGLYTAFSGYPLPEKMACCPCGCKRAEHSTILYSKPLRALQREELDYYAFCALTTMGVESDFKHFLPRLFELSVAVSAPEQLRTDREILFGKLTYGHWETWPTFERNAIRTFLDALWSCTLFDSWHGDEYSSETEEWICSIAQVEDDISPYLDKWNKTDTLEADLCLVSLLTKNAITQKRNAGRNAFWSGRDAQYEQLKNWVRSAVVAEKLERAAMRWASTDSHDEFVAARSMLE